MKNFVVVLVSIVVFGCTAMSGVSAMQPGGISDNEKEPNDEVQGYAVKLSPSIKTGALATLATSGGDANSDAAKAFEDATIQVVKYKTQVVAGTNYFMRVKISDFYFDARIYRDLKGNVTLNRVVGPKDMKDPIEYF